MSASATTESIAPSTLRAWFALIGLSMRRQARARQMVWVAIALLVIAVGLVALRTARNGWSSGQRMYSYGIRTGDLIRGKTPSQEPFRDVPLRRIIEHTSERAAALPINSAAASVQWAIAGALEVGLERSRINSFTRAIMFSLFLGFLLPIWSLSFASEALGGEREARSLHWLLTRPIPRWAIYIGKYLAMLPWALALNLGGFGLMCLAAGQPGREAFTRYWPAVAGGTLAFTSLFHMFAAATRRPTVVGLVYCFFLETMLGDMPGLLKRCSVSFYVRCLIFDEAAGFGVVPDKPSVYLPVSGETAWVVLVAVTMIALVLGAWAFSRNEYLDDGA